MANKTNTKEKILLTSLHLFAQHGYEAVSVSTISGELGITKGALYKHFKNKQDIFDKIVERMFQVDAQRAQQYNAEEDLKNFTLAQLSFWTEDPFAADFRKMLALERYRNEKMEELYHSILTAGPVSYMEHVFREMMSKGLLKQDDALQLALEYYAPLYLLIEIWDSAAEKVELSQLLETQIDRFIQTHTV